MRAEGEHNFGPRISIVLKRSLPRKGLRGHGLPGTLMSDCNSTQREVLRHVVMLHTASTISYMHDRSVYYSI